MVNFDTRRGVGAAMSAAMEAPRYLALGQHLASDVTTLLLEMLQLDRTAARVISSHFYVCSDSERLHQVNSPDSGKMPTLPSMAIARSTPGVGRNV